MSGRTPVPMSPDRAAIEADLTRRTTAYQARIAAVPAAGAVKPLNLLALGDSWFDYPLSDGVLPIPSDILVQLRTMLTPTPNILSLAHYGDATTELLGVTKRQRLINALQNPANGTFDAILFSGGGNDLVGEQFRLWLRDSLAAGGDATKALNNDSLGDIMGVVHTAYVELMAARDLCNSDLPIFGHAYDFALPTNNGVCTLGPWLYPSLSSRGWMQNTGPAALAVGAGIVKLILLEFDSMMRTFSAEDGNNFVYVVTQGTLGAADWANESHPTPGGFRKIAEHFATALVAGFPGRAAIVDA